MPGQLLDPLEVLTSEDLALTSQEVDQLLQSLPNVGSATHSWVIADNAADCAGDGCYAQSGVAGGCSRAVKM